MMSDLTTTLEIRGAVALLTLNRPDVHNAMSNAMVEEVIARLDALRDNRAVRVLVIGAAGKTFCAGGDIKDLQAERDATPEQRAAVMARFDHMLRLVGQSPQVTIARIQGAAMGGGFGLVCVSDIAIASDAASFGLPEVRMGLSPALISPYVIDRIGVSQARRLMLTGGRLTAADAYRVGVVHEVCPPEELDARVKATVNQVLECAPHALIETKALIAHVTSRSLDESLPYRTELIARLRASNEGQAGMLAALQKQKPPWSQTFE